MRPNGIPLPWQLKIAAKIVLSRLPLSYRAWSRLRLFRHGAMDDPSSALEIFREHFNRSGIARGFTMLELGPGDSLASAVTWWTLDPLPVRIQAVTGHWPPVFAGRVSTCRISLPSKMFSRTQM